jgi:hypothetical protein
MNLANRYADGNLNHGKTNFMKWTFTKGKKVSTGEIYYELFDGGRVKPEMLLHKPEEIEQLKTAIKLVKSFVDQAAETGHLEFY